ncbi:hypothetical protein, partial [Streptomyces sp. NRRL S-813]|uniref:hypothetical protein n=1 Tax=Streptomyces sp. NRRL S-813 TaxID=1463919 RepID=UPI001F2FD7BF
QTFMITVAVSMPPHHPRKPLTSADIGTTAAVSEFTRWIEAEISTEPGTVHPILGINAAQVMNRPLCAYVMPYAGDACSLFWREQT